VEGNVLVVFPSCIAIAAWTVERLRRVRLQTSIQSEASRNLKKRERIEFVAFIAIGKTIVQRRVGRIESAIRERIAFVGIIVKIFRENIVPFELESLAEALLHSYRETTVERFAVAIRHEDIAQIRAEEAPRRDDLIAFGVEQAADVDIVKGSEVNTLGKGEICINAQIGNDLLFIRYVRRIDSRVFVVFAEYANARKAREGIRSARTRCGRRGEMAWPGRATAKGRLRENGALLHPVGRDGADLRKHVLVAVVDAVASAQDRLVVLEYIPGKSDARLELLLRAV